MREQHYPRFRLHTFQHRGERRAYYVRDEWKSSWRHDEIVGGIGVNKRGATKLCDKSNAEQYRGDFTMKTAQRRCRVLRNKDDTASLELATGIEAAFRDHPDYESDHAWLTRKQGG